MSLLEVGDLSVRFGNADPVVKKVSFKIDKGETLALVGESGSGKSVTALSILRLLNYPYASHPSGSILFDGEELTAADEETLRDIRGNRAAMIFQEPMTSLNPLHCVERQVSETMIVHKGWGREKARARTLELLELVGLRNAAERLGALPHELSGGERQRVMIAMALANDPDLLIADEPTTALDVTVQAQILHLLKRLQKQFGMAMLFISHDLDVVRRIANRVAVMKDGEIVETGTVGDVLSRPQHPYTKMLLNARPSGEPVPVPDKAEELLRAEGITVRFPLSRDFWGRREKTFAAVDGVSLSVKRGETVAFVGESGSGKTTLAFALLKLLDFEGRVFFGGTDLGTLNGARLRPLRSKMQIVFQDPFSSLNPRLTVEEIVGEGLKVHKKTVGAAERREEIKRVLGEVGLDESALNRYPHEFSGGQRQRIAVARALILRPDLIVLDEPTSSLDVSVQAQIIDLLKALQKKYGLAYLFISHDMRVVKAIADRVYVMRNGKVVESGANPFIFKEAKSSYARDLMAAAFDFDAHGEK